MNTPTATEAPSVDHPPLSGMSGDELLTLVAETAAAIRMLEGVLTEASNEVAIRSDRARGSAGLAARHGYARPSQLLERVTGFSARTTSRLIKVGAAVGQRESDTGAPLEPLFPLVGKVLSLGLIGVETADAITRELQQAAPRADVEHLAAAEFALVGQATGAPGSGAAVPLSADLIAEQAKVWKNALDQSGIEPRAQKAFADRTMWMGATSENGVVPFGGKLTVDVAAKFNALFASIITPRTAPRFLAEEEEAARDLMKDPRTAGQQRADVFAAMIDALARSADVPTVSGAAPTVVVTASSDVLTTQEGTGKLVGIDDPVAFSTIKQIMCDAGIRPAVVDARGQLVALGNKLRAFTGVQREGMIARDGPTCGWEGCNVPATASEAHHVKPHAAGGPTDVSNGVLLCWFHHRLIELGEWVVEMIEGLPVFTPPSWMARKAYLE